LKCREDDLHIANAALVSCKRHLWYLTEELITFAIFDEELGELTRHLLAKKLWETPRPNSFLPGKPKFPVIDGNLPPLASFIGPRSWLIFKLLGLNGPQEWLQLPIYAVKCWSLFQDYRTARDYLVKLEVVNDSPERGIKLLTDFKDMAVDEERRQFVLQVVEFHRQSVPSLRKDDLDKLSSRPI